MIGIILQELKNTMIGNKVIFILSVLAFTCACIGINASLTGLMINAREKEAVEASFSGKTTYRIAMDGDSDTYMRVFGNKNTGKIKALFNDLTADPHFKYRYTSENVMDFFDPGGNVSAESVFPAFKEEFRAGYENGTAVYDEDYLVLKAIYADRDFCTETGVKIADGQAFEADDFMIGSADNLTVSVLLGSAYRDLYKTGDRIPYAHLGTTDPVTLVVTGFLDAGSYYYDNNAIKTILDRYMIVPAVETSYDGMKPDGSYDDLSHAAYDTMKLIGGRIICENARAGNVKNEIEEIFKRNGFSELRLDAESEGFAQYLDSSRESAALSLVITVFIIIMISLMICIRTVCRIIKNRKKYSIMMLNGITKMKMMLILTAETLLIFVCSGILFFILKTFIPDTSPFDLGLNDHSFPVIAGVMLILLMFIGIFGVRRVYRVDMSTVLREHE